MGQIAIIAEFTTHPDRFDDFLARMRTHGAASREEPGCKQFDIVIPRKGEHTLMLYEVYADQDAFDAHIGTDRIKAHRDATAEMVTGRKLHICDVEDSA